MLHPEIDLNEFIAVKALEIYEITKRTKQSIINEKTLGIALKNGVFQNPSEYFDSLVFLYMIGIVDFENGIVGIKRHENR
jgi:hypothetical protein